jgi:adenylyltransferase/sulfurtransferase
MVSDVTLTEEQIERYSRQILLPDVGGEGQRKLLRSSIFVVGAGGLGSPAILYLAAAGVGRLGIADSEGVQLSNLQRQIVHGTDDVGRAKGLSARETVRRINPECEVQIFPQRLTAANVRQAVRGYDVVLDCSDNCPTRFLISDSCWFEKIPLVSAAVSQFDGQLMTVSPPGAGNPCYRCSFPYPPPSGLMPSCQQAGVLGAAAGVMGTLQAVEALKILLGVGSVLSHRLLVYDALECEFKQVARERDPDCPLCGPDPSITDLVEYEASCVASVQG